MPLPEGGNTPWPPKECEQVYKQYATWAAWYSGDIETLSAVYGGVGGGRDTNGFFASETGGFKATAARVMDSVRRWFWGQRPTGSSQPRQRVHVPIAAEIASTSADLLFSEPPTVSVPVEEGKEPHQATADRLAEYIDDGMHATLLESAEICSALGGVYLRVVWDQDKRDRPWVTAVHPDAAVPAWKWGDLESVIFWRVLKTEGKTVVRHLEMHETGKILHGVYQGDNDNLGHPVPVTDYPDTKGLAEYLSKGNQIDTGATGLTAVYVPNMRPNRIWRNTPTAAYLGRSDYAGVEGLMDSLDMVKSSWMRDVDLGKARIIVSRDLMTSHGAGQGASIDLDREVYEGVNAMAEEGGKLDIKEIQFKIRVDEHQRTCAELKTEIVGSAGYSPQSFGFDGEVAVTATEVAAKTRRSLITRDRKTRYYRPQLSSLCLTMLEVDNHVFNAGVQPVKPQITWPDAVSVDPLALAQELRELETAKAISTEQKVRRLHPDWTDDEVEAEVELILEEAAPPLLEEPGAEFGPANGKPKGDKEDEK